MAAVDVYYAKSGSDLDDMDQESFPETRNPRLSIKSISREKFRSLITGQAHHMFSPFLNLQIYDFFSKKFSFICTGKSLLEDINPVSTNPKYDKRLFIDLPIQYMKTTSSKQGENMLCTQTGFCFDIQHNLCTQHVLLMF